MPKSPNPFATLENALGYTFQDKELLRQSLTRQSAIEEKIPNAAKVSYQRLEWRGDRAFNDGIADLLDKRLGQEIPVETINAAHATLISNKGVALIAVAKKLELNRWLIKGNGESNVTDKMLADALEAIIGAIVKDCVKKQTLEKFIAKHFQTYVDAEVAKINPVQQNIDLPVQAISTSAQATSSQTVKRSTRKASTLPAMSDHQKAMCLIFGSVNTKDASSAKKNITQAIQLDSNVVNAKSKSHKYTPLHYALKKGNTEVATFLVQSGATWEPWSRNKKTKTVTKTPEDLAKKGGLSDEQVNNLRLQVKPR